MSQTPRMPISLNANMHYVNREGVRETITVRQAIALGHGKAYESLKKMADWEHCLAKYNAEQADPLASVHKQLATATKNLEKASWWFDTGMYLVAREAQRSVTKEEEDDALADLKAADRLQQCWLEEEKLLMDAVAAEAAAAAASAAAAAEQEDIARNLINEFNETTLSDSYTGFPLARVGKTGAAIPIYPWPGCEENRSFTANFFSTGENVEVNYPAGTKITVNYTVPGKEGIFRRTAYVSKDGDICQVAKAGYVSKAFETIEEFIAYEKRMFRASVTVTLPDPLTGMERRVAEMQEKLRISHYYIPVAHKIAMIYDEFQLKSHVEFGHSEKQGQGVWHEGGGERVGTFVHSTIRDLEVEADNGRWFPVAPCGDKIYIRGILVDHLEGYVKDQKLHLRLSWNTSAGRRSAMIHL